MPDPSASKMSDMLMTDSTEANETNASADATEAAASDAPKKPKGTSPWNPIAVGFQGFGVMIGLFLLLFAGQQTYQQVDRFWLAYLGETKAYVTQIKVRKVPDDVDQYGVVLRLPKKGREPEAKVLVFNQKLYRYIKGRFQPPRELRVKAWRVKRILSGHAAVVQVGPIRLLPPPKSSTFIIYLVLLGLGGAVAFTSLRDLRRRWLRRGILS